MRRIVLLFALFTALIFPFASTAEIPRPEHPRPDFMREAWQNLNGEWGFAFDKKDEGIDAKWYERTSLPLKINVPFHVEAGLSGIGEKNPPKVCWYLKLFDLDDGLLEGDGRLLLHFGAVDYKADVWLNGAKIGEHTGGYSSFHFDVTDYVSPENNLLVLRVFDSKDPMQVRGKQTTTGKSYGIVYTTVTGIWQTVWVEKTGGTYISDFRFTSADDLSGGSFEIEVEGDMGGLKPWIDIYSPDGTREPTASIRWDGLSAKWKADITQPWSPEYPALYNVRLALRNSSGDVVDEVKTYVGIRTVEVEGSDILLNGEPFYQKLLLDQGYFPGGIYTPATDAIMRQDVKMYKDMGFNGIRKHQKVEDPRFLYWCDKLGIVVWEEMPSIGLINAGPVPEEAMDLFTKEWLDVMDRDMNHPSIITWTVYNENWGLYNMNWRKKTERWAYDAVAKTREMDPTRPVVDNSGGWHFDTDIWDFHHYLSTAEKSRKLYEAYDFEKGDHLGFFWYAKSALLGRAVIPVFYPGVDYQGQPIILSEYGGFGFYRVEGDKGLLELYRDYTLAIGDYPYT